MKIAKISEHIGAEVTGIDLRQPLDAATRQQLYRALVDNVALVIRDQHFSPKEFLAAAAQFGEPMQDEDEKYRMPDVPFVGTVDSTRKNKDGSRVYNGERWHSDHTNQEIPPKFTTLYAVELPDKGGATNLASSRAAFEALPEDFRQRIDGMKTVNVIVGSAARSQNSDRKKWQQEGTRKPVIQPLVRTNPDTGGKAIYFHPNKVENIEGMTPEATQDLLDELTGHVVRPAFTYTHKWRKGDMLIWDNRSALHRADFDYDPAQRRLLYRCLVKGERPH